jgi:hypothetical protein
MHRAQAPARTRSAPGKFNYAIGIAASAHLAAVLLIVGSSSTRTSVASSKPEIAAMIMFFGRVQAIAQRIANFLS